MARTEISYEVYIDAPRSQVWDSLADFGGVSAITPNVSASHLTSEGEVGVGSTRHCDLPMMGATTEERVTMFEEDKALGVEIYDSTKVPVIKEPHVIFTVADDADGTLLTLESSFDVGMGPIGAAMYGLVMSKRVERGWKLFLAGVKHYNETGEDVERDTVVPTAAVREVVVAA